MLPGSRVCHVASRKMVSSMILYWPVGGAKYRINGRKRFADHLARRLKHGLEKVVSLVSAEGKTFNADPRGGPCGCGYQERSLFCRIVRAAGRPEVQVDRRRDVSERFLTGIPRPEPSPSELFASQHSGAHCPRPRCLPRDIGCAVPGGMPPKAEYWDVAVAWIRRSRACRPGS